MCVSIPDFLPDVNSNPNTEMDNTSGTIFPDVPRCVVHPKISHNFRLQKLLCPRCVVQKNYCPRCHAGKKEMSQMCCSTILNDANVPDVMFRTFPKNPLSQMYVVPKKRCPRCLLQKRYCPRCHVLNISKKTTVPDVSSQKTRGPRCLLQKLYCPRCHVLSISKKATIPDVWFKKSHYPRCLFQK